MIPQNILFRIANALRNELLFAFPVKGTDLKNSIKVVPTERGLMISMLEYGKYVEFGSNPHVIRPRIKKALKFEVEGKDVIVKKVMHPGVRPTYFVRNTILNKLPGIIARELSR